MQYGTPIRASPDPIPVEQPHPRTPIGGIGPEDTDPASTSTTPVATPDRSATRAADRSQGGLTTPTQPMSPLRYRISTLIRSASAARSGPYETPQRVDGYAHAHRRSRTTGPSRKPEMPRGNDEGMQDGEGLGRSPEPHAVVP